MIIISQDKEIINFDNVTRIFIEDFSEDGDGFGIGADTNSAESQCWDLGYYRTEERAKEVLQEIADTYKGKELIEFQTFLGNDKLTELKEKYERQGIIISDRSYKVKEVKKSIYYMPEK